MPNWSEMVENLKSCLQRRLQDNNIPCWLDPWFPIHLKKISLSHKSIFAVFWKDLLGFSNSAFSVVIPRQKTRWVFGDNILTKKCPKYKVVQRKLPGLEHRCSCGSWYDFPETVQILINNHINRIFTDINHINQQDFYKYLYKHAMTGWLYFDQPGRYGLLTEDLIGSDLGGRLLGLQQPVAWLLDLYN